MQRRQLRVLLSAFLSLFFLTGVAKCENGPDVTVYISNPNAGGMDYSNGDGSNKGFVEYEKTDHFVCFTPHDTELLLNYCGIKQDE